MYTYSLRVDGQSLFKKYAYKFPTTAIKSYHKHSDLKQHNIILKFWSLEVQDESLWAQVKVSARL